MTEYGRGPGSEPWYPEDPLYGDVGYDGQQAPTGQVPYDEQQPGQYPYQAQPQYYQQQAPQHPQQPDPYGQGGSYDQSGAYDQTGSYGQWGTGQQPLPGQYQPGGPQAPGAQQGHPQAPGGYGHPQQMPGQAYGIPPGQNPGAGRPGQGGYPGQAPEQYQQHEQAGWDTGQHGQVPGAGGPADPYGQQPRGHQGQEPDPYGARGARPPGRPAGAMQPGPGRRPGPENEADAPTDWDPGPDQGEHAFFAGGGDDDDDDDDGRAGRVGRRGRGDRHGRGTGPGKKRRSGVACLVVAVVLVGGVGGVGYLGYQLYEDHFGPPPDFAGTGSGANVTVEIPKGAGGYTMGQLLKKSGVVKSVDAFVKAQQDNPKGQTIQDGVYTLKKQMSGESAVALMLDPKSHNSLIISEGRRNAWVYDQIDKRLGLKGGTTAAVAKKDWKQLGLPSWALNHKNLKDPLEGFLYPSNYPVAKGMKPEDILKRMVTMATQQYQAQDLDARAKELHLDGPWQVITVASLVQAEGKTHDDFRKMAEVVYNRLSLDNRQTWQRLQFDSTFNYLKGQSNIDISESEINSNHDPYNTYTQKGLPPGPIGNPGSEALAATLNPTHEGWFYFVATDGMNKTEFAKTYADFQKLKEKFNDRSAGN
ncbi:endolytic transglycosylase MltG [Streptomyces sp. TS71-3]|uniref:endolytic transglycosylase MltG n=1 Tax=Streptomyces sp. TS71-3 TaxID=2733862 RepID=UPI001B1DEB27|nr:endolytic transglycosylase MltG [Streptomyces sp. TS71-3]GHJ38888.1 membrane protein [Streptomyces sp. TS71-3]